MKNKQSGKNIRNDYLKQWEFWANAIASVLAALVVVGNIVLGYWSLGLLYHMLLLALFLYTANWVINRGTRKKTLLVSILALLYDLFFLVLIVTTFL